MTEDIYDPWLCEQLQAWPKHTPNNRKFRASVLIHEALRRIKVLEARLEIIPGMGNGYDGISCRDETIRLLETRAERLEAALRDLFEAVCGETGFAQAVRNDNGMPYPWPALDMAEAKARAVLGGEA